METSGPRKASTHFSSRRRTAAILAGEGTAVAYLTGVMKALTASGLKLDLVLGRGAGALVATFASVHAEKRLYGDGGLVQALSRRRPWRIRPFYSIAIACGACSFVAFLAPALAGLVSLLALPFLAAFRWLLAEGAQTEIDLPSAWVFSLLSEAEPYYLRLIAFPMILLFAMVSLRALARAFRHRGRASTPWLERLLPENVLDLAPLGRILEPSLWQAVRGASTQDRPRERQELGEAYRKLLSAGLGQHGFREVVFYALDTDSGQDVPFVMVKNRYLKKMRTRAGADGAGEAVDLAEEGAPLFFDALLAAVSPPGLVRSIPLKLPLTCKNGGEVHRFSSSVLAGRSAVADALAAGAEQIVYIAGFAPSEVSGSSWERLADAALRRSMEHDLSVADVPVFLIRPDKKRLSAFEFRGRAQLGNERLELSALVAHGVRDAERLFIRPVLGEELPVPADERTELVADEGWKTGPREL